MSLLCRAVLLVVLISILLIIVNDRTENMQEQSEPASIYQLVDGETYLHRAIRRGDQSATGKYIARYQADFDKIKDYLSVKYKWNPDDRVWLRKYNMIAVSEQQGRTCKELERSSMKDGDLEIAVFVILTTPIDGEDVAVIHPDGNNRLGIFKMVRELLPNGILSWSYTSILQVTNEGDETFIEVAAAQGRINVISQLYELGADLSLPDHCPLMAACSTVYKDSIRWLLTEHFDHFDCTRRNSYNINAFLVLVQEGDVEMMDFVLKKMILYRQKNYNETESEAFQNIFHYEDKASSLSSVGLARDGPILDKMGEYVSHYKLDLSYQWQRITILLDLMRRDVAVDYCWSEIRKNPKLLGMIDCNGDTVLQGLIRMGKVDVLPEIYQSHPEVKEFFENDRGINLLKDMLIYHKVDLAAFILEKHAQFLSKDLESLRKNVLLSNYQYNTDFYEKNGDLLVKHFPMYATEISEAREKAKERTAEHYHQKEFSDFNLEFTESTITAKDETQSLSAIRGILGLTLLHYAVDKDNTFWFVQLLESGCDINATDDEGNLPIHFVRSLEMFNLIIEKHPDGTALVHRTNNYGHTVLHKVCSLRLNKERFSALLEKVIECGANVNQLTKLGESALFMIGGPAGLEVLQKYNIDFEVVNNAGDNALSYHLRFNGCMAQALLPIMTKLSSFKDHAPKYLQRFLSYNQGTFSYYFQSFFEENPEATKAMFDSLFEYSAAEASRMFFQSCYSANTFLVEKFLEFDYDLDYNFISDDGSTPIMALCGYSQCPNNNLMRQLLTKGVNLEHRNQKGKTALLVLSSGMRPGDRNCHDAESVRLLLEHGAPINSTDEDGNTALHYAFRDENWELAELLLGHGADVLSKNSEGKIPLEMTSDKNRHIFQFMQ